MQCLIWKKGAFQATDSVLEEKQKPVISIINIRHLVLAVENVSLLNIKLRHDFSTPHELCVLLR